MEEETQSPDCCCRRFLVTGRVQRVGFRAATRRRASDLGLTGHARNLDDGRVEVIACGDSAAVDALREWLTRGPTFAKVTGVQDAGAAPIPRGPFITR